MPHIDQQIPTEWDRVSAARARALAQLALQRTEREAAEPLGISLRHHDYGTDCGMKSTAVEP